MVSPRSLLALVLVLSLLMGVGGLAAARPPPAPVCGVCTDQLAVSAADHGVDIRPGESRLSVQVFANGSARWTAQIDLTESSSVETDGRETTVKRTQIDVSGSNAIESLRTDDALRDTIVSGAHGRIALEMPANVTSTVSDGKLIVNYRQPGTIKVSGDTLVFTAFHADNPNRDVPLYGGADEIVLRSPEGYQITNGPTGDTASANGTVAVWNTTTEQSDSWEGPSIEYTKVKFAPVDRSAGNGPMSGGVGGVIDSFGTPMLIFSGVAVFLAGLVLLQYSFRVLFLRSGGGSDRTE